LRKARNDVGLINTMMTEKLCEQAFSFDIFFSEEEEEENDDDEATAICVYVIRALQGRIRRPC